MGSMTIDSATATRIRLLNAAAQIVQERGAARLTLDEVARVGQVSKGGLLYHFPNKEELVRALLAHALDSFETDVERLRKADTSPGAWLRAYIHASFPKAGSASADQAKVGAALIATLGTDPLLAEPYRERQAAWVRAADSDGIVSARAQAIRLAVDSLWLHEAMNISPYTPRQRQALVAGLLDLTKA